MGDRLSIRPRYGGGYGGMLPSASPSPRDQPGLTPRHQSPHGQPRVNRHVSPRQFMQQQQRARMGGSHGNGMNSTLPPRPPAPPAPPAPPMPKKNTKKQQLLMSIEEIDLQIAQKEQLLETAQTHKKLLRRSITTGTSVRELTRKDSESVAGGGGGDGDDDGDGDGGDGSAASSSLSSAKSKSKKGGRASGGGFVNRLVPTTLAMKEIVAKTLKENRKRAFASRARLSYFVDDGVSHPEQCSTIRGVPSLSRIRNTTRKGEKGKKGEKGEKGEEGEDQMVWTVADGANILPLYTTPQDSPSWHDVCLVHEQNKERIAEAISMKKLTTQKFVKAVASKYHHYYLAWQTRLQRITQGGKINNSRDSRRRDRANQVEDEGRLHDRHTSAYLEELMVQEEDYYSSTLAKVPKMIIGKRTREETALGGNNNSRIWNPAKLEHENLLRNPWSNSEKLIYLAKFLEYPKEFWKIATYLTNKTTNDCISFYYKIKKRIDLKALLKKQTGLRQGYRAHRNKDTAEAHQDQRFSHTYVDAKGNMKQQELLRGSMWSVLVDAVAALDVEIPIQLVDPYEEKEDHSPMAPRCLPLSSQLSDVVYTDWPEDHWTRFRSKDKAMGHFASLNTIEQRERTGFYR